MPNNLPKGGTPPLVPMWPQPRVQALNMNPFPFFPFNPRWGEGLTFLEYETFCTLLRLAWVSPRPGYLPVDEQELAKWMEPYTARGCAAPDENVLAHFQIDARTGLMHFPPQMKFLARLCDGENMYALLWEEA